MITKLKSRIRTIVVPYLVWNSLGAMLNTFKGDKVLSKGMGYFILNNYILNLVGTAQTLLCGICSV